MEMEDLANLRTRVMNLSDASPVSAWTAIIRQLGDMYKLEIAEVLTGATSPTLATERSDAETDILAAIAEFATDTSQ